MKAFSLRGVLLAVAFAACLAGLIWQQREISRLQREVDGMRTVSNALLASRAGSAPRMKAPTGMDQDSSAELQRLRTEIAELRDNPANSWQERAALLRELVAGAPDLNIPEFQLLTDEDWLSAAKEKLDTEESLRRALANLRNQAIGRFASDARQALVKYSELHGGGFPGDPAELESYLKRSLGPAVWRRYAIKPASTIPNVRVGGDSILTQNGPVDAEYDTAFIIGLQGHGSTSYAGLSQRKLLESVFKAFSASNPGKQITSPEQLLPFATTPEQREALQKQMARKNKGS